MPMVPMMASAAVLKTQPREIDDLPDVGEVLQCGAKVHDCSSVRHEPSHTISAGRRVGRIDELALLAALLRRAPGRGVVPSIGTW